MRLAVAGLAIGLVASFGLTRLMASMLYQIEPTDMPNFAAAAAMLLAVALVACYLPARRATRVDPTSALRHD